MNEEKITSRVGDSFERLSKFNPQMITESFQGLQNIAPNTNSENFSLKGLQNCSATASQTQTSIAVQNNTTQVKK